MKEKCNKEVQCEEMKGKRCNLCGGRLKERSLWNFADWIIPYMRGKEYGKRAESAYGKEAPV